MKKLLKLLAMLAIGTFAFGMISCSNSSSSSDDEGTSVAVFVSSDELETVTFKSNNTFSVYSSDFNKTVASGTYEGDVSKDGETITVVFKKFMNMTNGNVDDVTISKTIKIENNGTLSIFVYEDGKYYYNDSFTRKTSNNNSSGNSGSGSDSNPFAGTTWKETEDDGETLKTNGETITFAASGNTVTYTEYPYHIFNYTINNLTATFFYNETPSNITFSIDSSDATTATYNVLGVENPTYYKKQ